MHSRADYVPLHLHTEYSLLDGAIRIKELVARAQEFRLPAVAMTDHGNLFGAVNFYREVIKAGIKPIIGCEIYLAPGGRFDRGDTDHDQNAFHLILLAATNDGYRNLVALVTRAYTEGFYYKPRIDMDLLEQYSGGLIALSACLKGEIPHYLQRGMLDKARERALAYKHILGPENFYFEIQANTLPEQTAVNRQLMELGRELHIGLVATNDCHYLKKEDARAHEVLLCIQTGKTVKDVTRMKFSTNDFYLKSPEEMTQIFGDVPEAIRNTVLIAERCNVEFALGKSLLPKFVAEEEDPFTVLQRHAREGLQRKVGPDVPAKYEERMAMELDVIRKMGYESYFLIVWDFIHYARSKGIPVGPGRGSAAGSLVSYCLDITELDPIRYNLLFERFLNPERISMPDIDVDFCQNRRDEVIAYVTEKYGKDYVAQIITFGTMAAKAAIRDVGRALDMPYAEVDRIAKLVPNTLKITIEGAIKAEPQLKELYDTDDQVRELLDIAMRLEGLNRHASTHAAGVVIAPKPLTDFAPLYRSPADGSIMTQFDMNAVEKIGLLKFDFLGLKTLTVIEKTLKYIKQGGTELKIEDMPFDDQKTFDLLSSGQTTGIFQLESEGMRDILVRMMPNRFEDLIALVALYRPGPMQWIDDFIKRKKGQAKVTYQMPQLKEILDETYGIMIYQEQVMMVANKIANFTMGQADILRRAMGKKKREEMEKQKETFIKGAVANGIAEKKAAKLFETMEPFAEYGFNKSHSAAYAYIAYQTAYLKAHYPVEFMAATLSLDMSDTDKIVKSINECRKMQIEILPPDINLSDSEFTVIGNSIRFGLAAVKGVGEAAIEAVIEARNADGAFASLEDFAAKVDSRRVNRKVIESLVKAGAFDRLGVTRSAAFARLADLIGGNGAAARDTGQQSFFGDQTADEQQETTAEWDEGELLRNEKEALGFYITGHPLTRYASVLARLKATKTSELAAMTERADVVMGGVVRMIRKRAVKATGDLMAYLTFEDDEGSVEVIVFSDLYRNSIDLLKKDAVLLVRGDLDRDEKGVRVRAREITRLENGMSNGLKRIEISIPETWENEQLTTIRELVTQYPGDCQLFLKIHLHQQRTRTLIATSMGVSPDSALIGRLESMVGRGGVVCS